MNARGCTHRRSNPPPSGVNDACVACYCITSPLILAREIDGDTIVGCYRCACGATWFTGYSLDEEELRKALAARARAAA